MGRPKKTTATLSSTADCTDAMRRLLVATLDLEKETAVRDGKVACAMQQHEKPINALTERCQDLELQLRNYYMMHLKEMEKDGRKSIQLQYGIMGRRFGKPALRLLNRAWTWGAVLGAVAEQYGKKFLRLRDPELDKDRIKAEIPAEDLPPLGLKLEQDEAFYVDLFRPESEG